MTARLAAQWASVPVGIGGITLLALAADANAITVGFLYLPVVLGLATWAGWAVGAAASVAATLCLNFFFLPPVGSFHIEDPSNWVALGCFLASSTLVSHLTTRARREARARESDALKTALLRAVSHDLRTPLTAMRLEIESLEPKLADRPEALASLRGLSLQQERLTHRIDNLLALARLEAGVARPHPEPTPAGSLFRSARESLALILDGRTLEVRVPPQCPDLWIDPSLMLEVLVNLLENAARAAPPNRPLELSAEPGPGGRVRIEVRDRGPGMPSAFQGGGLGLHIARSLAGTNGGSLDLLDRPGGGTIARLDLPAAPEPPPAEEMKELTG